MNDHEYRPFSEDFPFCPATRAEEWEAHREHMEFRKTFGLPDPPLAPYDPDDESVMDGAR